MEYQQFGGKRLLEFRYIRSSGDSSLRVCSTDVEQMGKEKYSMWMHGHCRLGFASDNGCSEGYVYFFQQVAAT